MSGKCARFGKFNLIGILGAVIQLTVFGVLVRWRGLSEVAAAAVAVEVVLLNNFFWHERFTWADRRRAGLHRRLLRLARFHAANGLVSLAGNTAIVWLLVRQFRAPALPSAVAAIALCAPINFLLADRWVYRAPADGLALDA